MKIKEILKESKQQMFQTQLERVLEKLHDLETNRKSRFRTNDDLEYQIETVKLNFFRNSLGLNDHIFNHLSYYGGYVQNGEDFENSVDNLYRHISQYGNDFNPIADWFIKIEEYAYTDHDNPIVVVENLHVEPDTYSGYIAETICDDTQDICVKEKDIKWAIENIIDKAYSHIKYEDDPYNAFSAEERAKLERIWELHQKTPNTYIFTWRRYIEGNMKGRHFSLMRKKA